QSLIVGQKIAKIGIEQAVLGNGLAAIVGEEFQPGAEGLARFLAGEEWGLVKQRIAALRAAELVIFLEELLPLGAAGRSRVDGKRRSVPAIREQCPAILRDRIANARQVAAIAGLGVIGFDEVAIRIEDVEEIALAEGPHAEQIFERAGVARVVDD